MNRPIAPRWLCLGLALIGALGLSACGGYVSRGQHLFHEGRYLESAELLAQHEEELSEETPKRQAEYATYRGLSLLVLGNYPEAHRWMSFAYSLEQSYPGSLRRETRVDLERGWWELSRRMQPQQVLRTQGAAAVFPTATP